MANKDLIESGELEFYVAGLLSEDRMLEISKLVGQDENVRKEVEQIEAVVMRLAKESNSTDDEDFVDLLKKIVTDRVPKEGKVIPLKQEDTSKKTIDFKALSGWAAAILLLIFVGLQFQNNQTLQSDLTASMEAKAELESRLETQNFSLTLKENMIASITSENTKVIQLAGQKISPTSNVKVFWDTENNRVVLDTKNLPKAPEGMVYQLWSLKMTPLTPTSLGLLEDKESQQNLFLLDNKNLSEGFGITLEPAGGSKTPTLEKLYVLGVVAS
ncbi:MAG: anti-sigma factor [Flavobacteriaceae bacterium]|nr:anti-sigma factor [Flavobacteriaceae bacterium]|tara:strand:+ start:459949 stop:460764 length:816 start_codon:yes stop_codon:yes gene_type:complete